MSYPTPFELESIQLPSASRTSWEEDSAPPCGARPRGSGVTPDEVLAWLDREFGADEGSGERPLPTLEALRLLDEMIERRKGA